MHITYVAVYNDVTLEEMWDVVCVYKDVAIKMSRR